MRGKDRENGASNDMRIPMKAAVLKALGSPLAVETVPDPVLGTGEVIVDVSATKVLAYAGEVFSGKRRYLLEPPVIPGAGCIGRVRQVGPDATELAVGDWVFCDPTVRSRDNAQAPDIILQGLTAGSERAKHLQKYFHDGSWADRTRVPTECAVRIGPLGDAEAVSWCAFGNFVVPYGGYVAANLQAGEVVLVNGATGAFVLMGGIGPDVAVPYSWLMRNCITIRGQWMYPRDAIARLIAMVRAGLLSLGHHQAKCFSLDDVNEAIAHAAAYAGPFNMTVLRP